MTGIHIALGTGMIVLMTVIHVIGLIGLANTLPRLSNWARHNCPRLGAGIMLMTSVIWLITIHTIEVWIWALVYMQIGEFGGIASALYFSTVTATTLGFGDVVLSPDWRLLSAFEAMGGLILFGASTAFLLSVMAHLFKQMEEK